MKILHVCESIIGGTGSYLAELIPHQVRRYGADNIALLIPESQVHFLEPGIVSAAAKVMTFKRPGRLTGSFHLMASYRRALKSFDPDLVHAHSSIAGAVVRLLRASPNAGIVFCPHGWSVDMMGAKRIRKLAEFAERMLAKLPDRIIVISHHEYKRALELGVDPARLTLVSNGISREVPTVPAAEWVDHRIKVLYAGRFDYQKGVDVLLKAVKGLEDRITVRLIGDVAVDHRVFSDPMPANVTKIGWQDRNGVASQMKSCDILVVPSRWEGFGLVAVEAMRLSRAVAASSVGGLKEILGDGRYGYMFPAEDHVALHEFLGGLDRAELKQKAEAGYQRFLSEYTSDKMVDAIDAVYAQEVGAIRARKTTA